MSELIDRITINPEQCGGRPCIRGMRIRVKDVLEMLAGGATEKEILEDFPDLEQADIRASLAYALDSLETRRLIVQHEPSRLPQSTVPPPARSPRT